MTSLAANDFDEFVNSDWKTSHTIPDDRSRWGTFDIMQDQNLKRQKQLLESNPETLVGKFYKLLMNTPTHISSKLTKLLLTLSAVNSVDSYQRQAANLLTVGVSPLLHIYKGSDPKNPDLYVPNLVPTGIFLPDRDYYTDKPEIQEPAENYMIQLFTAYGYTLESTQANSLFLFERELARLHYTRAQRRDPDLRYNPRTYDQLVELLPEFFSNLGSCGLKTVIVSNTQYLEKLGQLLQATPPETLKNHLLFHVMNRYYNTGPDTLYQIGFNFHGKVLDGQQQPKPRWKRAISVVNSRVGDELGKLYAAKYFNADQQARCSELISFLTRAYGEIITEQSWMSPETKTAALDKLKKIGTSKVGIPSKWHSVEGLWEEGFTDIFSAMYSWGEWDWKYQEVDKFYTAVDRDLWEMTPQTINAYYHPLMNEIVFPAGILQPPFFGESEISNFGAIGVVIGHEMTHGFDDQGSKYTADGKLEEWWSPTDREKFSALTKVVADYYSGLKVFDHSVNGQLTLGENIADIGGLKIALRGLRMKYGELTDQQLDEFFRSYAQVWKILIRKQFALKLLTVDPHSPCKVRINGALAHIPEFQRLYKITSTDRLYLHSDQQMKIW